MWLAGPQLPNQGLNLGHSSESPESCPLGHEGTPPDVLLLLHFLMLLWMLCCKHIFQVVNATIEYETY